MIPRTLFAGEHELFRESVRTFLEREVAPHHADWERDGSSQPRGLAEGRRGWIAWLYGPGRVRWPCRGFFCSAPLSSRSWRKIGATGPAFYLHSDIVMPYIEQYGSEEQKRRWLPGMVAGTTIGAIAMTEPGAGSDLQGIRTRAILDGNHYVLNGQKTFISNGQLADLVIVVAKTDPDERAKGTSLILVERDRDGFERGRKFGEDRLQGAGHVRAVL